MKANGVKSRYVSNYNLRHIIGNLLERKLNQINNNCLLRIDLYGPLAKTIKLHIIGQCILATH